MLELSRELFPSTLIEKNRHPFQSPFYDMITREPARGLTETVSNFFIGNDEKFWSGTIGQDPVRFHKRDDGKAELNIDVPGYSKDQLSVHYDGDYVKIVAYKSDRDGQNAESKQSLNFSVYLPNVDKSTLEASVKEGVLILVGDYKQQQVEQGKQIPIK